MAEATNIFFLFLCNIYLAISIKFHGLTFEAIRIIVISKFYIISHILWLNLRFRFLFFVILFDFISFGTGC